MITFADYMDRVLYGPAGYYSTGAAKSGKSGDYFTAPDVGPVFGQLLAEIFKSWNDNLKADPFSVIEAGAGEGRLAQDIMKAHPFRYLAVERSPIRSNGLKKLKEQFPNFDVYETFAALKGQPLEGVLFGNELIDAFPVHRVRMKNGKLEECYVSDGEKWCWGPPSTPRLQSYFDRLGITLPDDYETEVNLAMSEWLADVSGMLRKGLVVLIDYGRPAHEYYAPERSRGTLRCFNGHRVIDPFFLSSPQERGSMGSRLGHSGAMSLDWTSDVDFSSLALDAKASGFTPLAFMEMGTFLMAGFERIKDPQSLSRGGLKYLLHPEGMGSAFHVLVLGKGLNPDNWVFKHNRLGRLGC
jgi:SAM-dependent MidA family methyltransferase